MELVKGIPHVKEVRGKGLLVGIEFDETISSIDVKHKCFDKKLLLTAIGGSIIRMVPPLILEKNIAIGHMKLLKKVY